jgi:hypothetical protein
MNLNPISYYNPTISLLIKILHPPLNDHDWHKNDIYNPIYSDVENEMKNNFSYRFLAWGRDSLDSEGKLNFSGFFGLVSA